MYINYNVLRPYHCLFKWEGGVGDAKALTQDVVRRSIQCNNLHKCKDILIPN